MSEVKKQRYEVTYHCNGVDETEVVYAASPEEARKKVEATFPQGRGWYVKSINGVPVSAPGAGAGAEKKSAARKRVPVGA